MKKIHLTFALISIIAVTEANAISYKFKTVDVPGATQTWGSQINASGHVIGGYSDATSSQHGFIYNDGTLTILDVPGSFDTNPAGINSNGQVIGTYNDGDFFSPQNHGFTYSGGTFTSYDAPNSLDNTSFNKINDSGQIIGVTYLQESPERLAAFIYDNNNGNITHIGDFNPVSINFNGQVVAGYNPGFILYSNGQNLNLSVPNSSGYDNPTSINDSGQVVGSYYDINSTYHGFLYRDGRYTNLDIPEAAYTIPSSISANSQIVGYSFGTDNNLHGFVYSNGVFTIINVPGALSTVVNSNNASGQLTGYYTDNFGVSHGFVANPVNTPKSKKDCMHNGWKSFGFKNLGQCIRYLAKQK